MGTAGRIKTDPRLPYERNTVRLRTVSDPLAGVGEQTFEPILAQDPSAQPVTLFRWDYLGNTGEVSRDSGITGI